MADPDPAIENKQIRIFLTFFFLHVSNQDYSLFSAVWSEPRFFNWTEKFWRLKSKNFLGIFDRSLNKMRQKDRTMYWFCTYWIAELSRSDNHLHLEDVALGHAGGNQFLQYILLVQSATRKRGIYWVPQKLSQICTVILKICIGKVAWFPEFVCGNLWNA